MRRREEANKRSVYGNQWAASTDEWGSDFVQLAAVKHPPANRDQPYPVKKSE
jgi:hypothetical protein